ncbi:MAG: T9SS type A sorting domain-containing protein [Flavobacteriales bacterium]|jgi:hypothetical protein
MKKLLLTALVIGLTTFASAQNLQWAQSITNLNQPDQVLDFDTNGQDRMALLGQATAGSNIALLDNATEVISSTLYFVAVYNDQAEMQWSAPTVGYPYVVLMNDAGEVFVVGGSVGVQDFDPSTEVQNVDLGAGALYVQKLSPTGDLIWVGTSSLATNATAVCQADDGRIFVSGAYSVPATIQLADGTSVEMTRGADILEFSTTGALVGCYSLDVPNQIDYINVSDMACVNNQLVVVGDLDGVCDFDPMSGISNNQETAEYDGYIVSYDVTESCMLQWRKVFRGNSWNYCHAVRMDDDNTIYIGGNCTFTTDYDYEATPGTWTLFSDGNTNLQSAFVAKLSSQGEFQWLKKVGADNESLDVGSIWTRDLELKDGGLVALIEGYGSIYMDGTTTSTPVVLGGVAAPGYMVAEFDLSGTFESVAKADTTGVGVASFCGVFPKRLETLNSNRFVVAGNFMQFINFGTQQNPVVLSNDQTSPNYGFDRDIFVACYIGSSGLNTEGVVSIAASSKLVNPMRDELIVLAQAHDISRVAIYTLEGKSVAIGQSNRLDVRGLPNGIYMVELRMNDGTVSYTRVVKD